jgi:hypothetical protein
VKKQSALSSQDSANPVYRKGRKERKGTGDDFVSSVVPLDHTPQQHYLATFALFAVQSFWLNADG